MVLSLNIQNSIYDFVLMLIFHKIINDFTFMVFPGRPTCPQDVVLNDRENSTGGAMYVYLR